MNKLILFFALMMLSVCAFASQPQPAPKFVSVSDMEKVVTVYQQAVQNAELNAPTSEADCGCNEVTVKPDDIVLTACVSVGKAKTCVEIARIEFPLDIEVEVVVSL